MPNFMARLMYFKRKKLRKKKTYISNENQQITHNLHHKHYIRSLISIFDKIWVSLWNLWPKARQISSSVSLLVSDQRESLLMWRPDSLLCVLSRKGTETT